MQTKNKVIIGAVAAFILIGAPVSSALAPKTDTEAAAPVASATPPPEETSAAPEPTPTPEEATPTPEPEPEPTPEEATPTPEPEPEPTPTPEPEPEPVVDYSVKWGQKLGLLYEDVEITVKVDKPKASTNMFDDDNLEAKVTVCNKGDATVEGLSAMGLGMFAEDKDGGQYSLYGAYRTPEFPVYSMDETNLRKGKCRTGWVAFEDGKKAVLIGFDVDGDLFSWSKSGK